MDELKRNQPISMDKVALWLGWDQINMRLAQEQIINLTEENQRLNQMLADARLKGKENEAG